MGPQISHIDKFLSRLGISSDIKLSEDGLEALHRAQVHTIPFENFDILLGRPISLSWEPLFQKLVLSRRGGYCFELNLLFLEMTKLLGFQLRPLMARVHITGKITGREHLISLIRIKDRDWIADVGFGVHGLRVPMPFELGRIAVQGGCRYRLIESDPFGIMLQVEDRNEWQNLYSFDLGYVCDADIEQGNYFTQTHPDHFLTYSRIATRPTEDGRVSLMDFTLRHISKGREDITHLEPGQVYMDALRENFGIVLDVPYEALRPVNA